MQRNDVNRDGKVPEPARWYPLRATQGSIKATPWLRSVELSRQDQSWLLSWKISTACTASKRLARPIRWFCLTLAELMP